MFYVYAKPPVSRIILLQRDVENSKAPPPHHCQRVPSPTAPHCLPHRGRRCSSRQCPSWHVPASAAGSSVSGPKSRVRALARAALFHGVNLAQQRVQRGSRSPSPRSPARSVECSASASCRPCYSLRCARCPRRSCCGAPAPIGTIPSEVTCVALVPRPTAQLQHQLASTHPT